MYVEIFYLIFGAVVAGAFGKEIEQKSEIRFGWEMSFEYYGQM